MTDEVQEIFIRDFGKSQHGKLSVKTKLNQIVNVFQNGLEYVFHMEKLKSKTCVFLFLVL